ncbi:hypothetical protein HELRODRAFT_100226 [Helobdella robusta]|uniref:Protein unc-50 homolog n=1 Tax=Helobdella robusta TaxID=6412 RepID=T1ECZ0_HELRO|nr:hypothetical protein HELRODRAFT_100226 [Helobdella robusta]ESO03484.1 hypothetical protein HELRODRAFT_100226 [Helobdella robusta]
MASSELNGRSPQSLSSSPPSSPSSASSSLCFQLSATAKRQKFLRRLFKFRQMDFEYALWQVIYLFIAPQKVYRNFSYRKQTKNQWARDDPAFLVLLTICLIVSSLGYSIVLELGVAGFFKFFFFVIFIDCIAVGIIIATLLWFITNRYLIVQPPTRCDVEWAYCFDIHLNAFFPLLTILHFLQLPFLNYFISYSIIMCFCSNTVWFIAIGYYLYITFLGYSLPFLKRTRMLLYPFTIVAIIYVLSVILNINFDRILCDFYHFRTHGVVTFI